jgi:hypothetical protein
MGKHLAQLAEKLGTGTPLAEAIRNDPVFPPVYAAVVEAGIQSGNLAAALDSVAQSARTLRDCRSFLVQTALYPMVLFTTLWFVFTGLFLFVGPRFAAMFEAYRITTPLLGIMQWASANTTNALAVMTLVPIALWVLFVFWYAQSSRGNLIQSAGRAGFFQWVPWLGKAAVQMQKATFAQLFAMLVRSSVPLDQAILLAARATSDRYWPKENYEQLQMRIIAGQRESDQWSVISGQQEKKLTTDHSPLTTKNSKPYPRSPISPLIIWALGITEQSVLLEGLEQYAKMSRVRADLLIARCELILPGLITFVFAVAIGMCYFMTIAWPYLQIMDVLTTFRG